MESMSILDDVLKGQSQVNRKRENVLCSSDALERAMTERGFCESWKSIVRKIYDILNGNFTWITELLQQHVDAERCFRVWERFTIQSMSKEGHSPILSDIVEYLGVNRKGKITIYVPVVGAIHYLVRSQVHAGPLFTDSVKAENWRKVREELQDNTTSSSVFAASRIPGNIESFGICVSDMLDPLVCFERVKFYTSMDDLFTEVVLKRRDSWSRTVMLAFSHAVKFVPFELHALLLELSDAFDLLSEYYIVDEEDCVCYSPEEIADVRDHEASLVDGLRNTIGLFNIIKLYLTIEDEGLENKNRIYEVVSESLQNIQRFQDLSDWCQNLMRLRAHISQHGLETVLVAPPSTPPITSPAK